MIITKKFLKLLQCQGTYTNLLYIEGLKGAESLKLSLLPLISESVEPFANHLKPVMLVFIG